MTQGSRRTAHIVQLERLKVNVPRATVLISWWVNVIAPSRESGGGGGGGGGGRGLLHNNNNLAKYEKD